MEYRWDDRKVTSLLGKFLILAWTFMVGVLLAPVWLPLDWVLKRCGRRGFVVRHPANLTISLTRRAFERAPE